MWFKILVIFVGIFAVASSGNTRKLLKPPKENYENLDFSLFDGSDIFTFVDPDDGISYRLPNDTIGLTYDIFLSTEIHRGEFGFSGETKILIQIVENTDQITLQYRQMNIHSVTLLDVNNRVVQQNVPWIQNSTVEFLIIRPNIQFNARQRYFVVISHSGTLRDDGLGWYRSTYLTPDGERRWLATTQFQATEARHVFPCFDEPARRSLFSVTIRHHASYTALSNMPVVSRNQVQSTDYVITKFAQTPSMQSYLVAFTVSDFNYVENAAVIPPQRIYGRSQAISNGDGDMALEASVKLMAKFENYINIPYSFPKMDQFACPDFIFGAMENWGLAIYVEPLLLFNKAIDRTRDEENIKTIVSHEFAVSFKIELIKIYVRLYKNNFSK
jgi:aminopeptidase N